MSPESEILALVEASAELREELRRAPTIPPVKSCGCGRDFDPSTWAQLPHVGEMQFPRGHEFELRACDCGNTLSLLRRPT